MGETCTNLRRPNNAVDKSITAVQAANATLLFEYAKVAIKSLTTASFEAISSFIQSDMIEQEAIPERLKWENKDSQNQEPTKELNPRAGKRIEGLLWRDGDGGEKKR